MLQLVLRIALGIALLLVPLRDLGQLLDLLPKILADTVLGIELEPFSSLFAQGDSATSTSVIIRVGEGSSEVLN